MMSSARATYTPTLSPLSMGQMLNSARSTDSPINLPRRCRVYYNRKTTWTEVLMRQKAGVLICVALLVAVSARAEETRLHIAAFNESGSLIRPEWLSERFTKRVIDELKPVRTLIVSKGPAVESNDLLLDRARKAYAHVAMTGSI